MISELPKNAVAETLADKIVALKPGTLPAATRRKCEDLLIDVVGLCVTARNEDYIKSALAGWDDDGPCTAIGHKRTLNASGAAFVNGTAPHGADRHRRRHRGSLPVEPRGAEGHPQGRLSPHSHFRRDGCGGRRRRRA